MGAPRKGIPWLPEQDEALKLIWHSGERIKSHIHLFGEHSYAAILTRAYELRLGKREKCPRGQAPIAEKLMLRELEKGPVNRFKLADILQIDPSTTHKRLLALHRAGKVSISGWERRSAYSAMVPIYRVGNGIDSPKPPKRSNAENERRRRARNKERRVMGGETVKTVNPFNTAMNQILQIAA